MARTRGFQIVALQNMDRLLLKSMLNMIERHLDAKWVETMLSPTVLFADSDTPEGFAALDNAKKRGVVTVAISQRATGPWAHVLARPVQTRALMTLLNQIDAQQSLAGEAYVLQSAQKAQTSLAEQATRQTNAVSARAITTRAPTDARQVTLDSSSNSSTETLLLRKAGNLYQYLVRQSPGRIVDVRFAPGRSLMFNHALGEYCSAILPQHLISMALQPVQETAHGDGQANAEWSVAKRMLTVRSIEDLTWAVAMAHSGGVPLADVANASHALSRLPRSTTALTPAELSMAKMLMRTPCNVATLARGVGVPLKQAVDFCNAAFACGLLRAPAAPVKSFASMLSSAALLSLR
jgi:hypothetical protein